LFGNCSYRVVRYNRDGDPISNIKQYGLYHILTDEFLNDIQEWTCGQLNIDTEPYPKRALKESIANAVAHAAYFESDGDIIIELYPDRIII
jgi:predicted HTH transcriptional regulator